MLLIDMPFKRVAVDIVGVIAAPSEGHQYILTLVDYTTRYPEAVPVKMMFDIYSRVDIPEEVSTDQVTQFLCTNQVSQFLFQCM